MGYYTYHKLYVLNDKMQCLDDETDEHQVLITRKVLGGDFNDSNSRMLFEDSCKWYECDEDMKKHSLEHPDLLFEIDGVGEENEDLWINYYKNGKMQHCPAQIVYPKYDPNKMQ